MKKFVISIVIIIVVAVSIAQYTDGFCILCSKSNDVVIQPSSKPEQNAIKKEAKNNSGNEDNKNSQIVSILKSKFIKKAYEDEWCNARAELNEVDANFAKTELNDWFELQGKYRAKYRASSANESFYANNSLISSYEALPVNELESLAFQGDRFAMVTFVQTGRYSDRAKQNEISKKMLVQGVPYFALEHLTVGLISAAQSSYRRSGSVEEAKEYLKNALVYVFWGLENYNESAFQAFIATTSDSDMTKNYPLETLLAESGPDIKKRVAALSKWIQQERDKQGINTPSPSDAVKAGFSELIAFNRLSHEGEIDFLSNLAVMDNNVLDSKCAKENLERMRFRINRGRLN
jgi:hypothetical protein